MALSANQRRLVQYIKEEGGVTVRDHRKFYNHPEAFYRSVKQLVDAGILTLRTVKENGRRLTVYHIKQTQRVDKGGFQ